MDSNSGLEACKAWLAGKTVTLMGLGLLGRGVGDAAFFAAHAKHVIVTDLKTKEDLADSVSSLAHISNITFVLGEHRETDFTDVDIVCKGAGVPYDSLYIEKARKAGVEVVMSTAVFAKYARMSGARLIGVTGTRGKTTVTHMIHHILSSARIDGVGIENYDGVHIGGNIRGMSTLQLLDRVRKGDVYVLELDSWQLQGFRDMQLSPHLGVFTTFMEDHVNYYRGNFTLYLDDKAQIFLHQLKDEVCIVGSQCAELVTSTYGASYAGKFKIVNHDIPREVELSVIGAHNRYNAALAVAAAEEFSIPQEKIYSYLKSFHGVSGRLERVADVGGVVWINDTTATTPMALHTALAALNEAQLMPYVLIAGGADKGLHIEMAVEALKMAQVTILLPGTGTSRLAPFLAQGTYIEASSMDEAVQVAYRKSMEMKSKAVVLSPGFASFGLFKNEYDRGDAFIRALHTYVKK